LHSHRGAYVAVAVNVTGVALDDVAVTVCFPTADPSVHGPEIATPSWPVTGAVGMSMLPPPVVTVYVTVAPMIRFPAASFTWVQSGSLRRDPARPD